MADGTWWWRMAADAGDSDAAVLAAAGTTPRRLGRRVRARWLGWAKTQPAEVLAAHPDWLLPYDALSPAAQRVDDEIGADLYCAGWQARGGLREAWPHAPGHRSPNEILRDAARALPAALPGLRAEYDAAAAALFDMLAGGHD